MMKLMLSPQMISLLVARCLQSEAGIGQSHRRVRHLKGLPMSPSLPWFFLMPDADWFLLLTRTER
jgi:hypothetical protein